MVERLKAMGGHARFKNRHSTPEDEKLRQEIKEREDLSRRATVLFLVVMLVTMLLVMGAVYGWNKYFVEMPAEKARVERFNATHWVGQEVHIPSTMQCEHIDQEGPLGIITINRAPDHKPQTYRILDTNGGVKGTIIEDQ